MPVIACVALGDSVTLRLGLAVGVGVLDAEGVCAWLGVAVAVSVGEPKQVGVSVPEGLTG